jgi:hypothetical protein
MPSLSESLRGVHIGMGLCDENEVVSGVVSMPLEVQQLIVWLVDGLSRQYKGSETNKGSETTPVLRQRPTRRADLSARRVINLSHADG